MNEPTNADLLREIKAITKITDDHEQRLKDIEHYKTTQEAVAEYVAKYGTSAQKEGRVTGESDNKELVKTIVKLFSLFTGIIALIYAIIQALGK